MQTLIEMKFYINQELLVPSYIIFGLLPSLVEKLKGKRLRYNFFYIIIPIWFDLGKLE